jgi:hypothetical protein
MIPDVCEMTDHPTHYTARPRSPSSPRHHTSIDHAPPQTFVALF